MTTVQFSGSNGEYKVEKNFDFVIDQDLTSNPSHKAKLVYVKPNTMEEETNPTLTITFTPAFGAPKEVKDDGVKTWFYFSTSTAMQFLCNTEGYYDTSVSTATDIFTFGVTADVLNPEKTDVYDADGNVEWTEVPGTDGALSTFTYTLNKAKLDQMINFGTFYLDDITAYRAFESVLTGVLIFHVTDGVDSAQAHTN